MILHQFSLTSDLLSAQYLASNADAIMQQAYSASHHPAVTLLSPFLIHAQTCGKFCCNLFCTCVRDQVLLICKIWGNVLHKIMHFNKCTLKTYFNLLKGHLFKCIIIQYAFPQILLIKNTLVTHESNNISHMSAMDQMGTEYCHS